MRLPPIREKILDLPYEELGKLMLDYWIAAQAESAGLDPLNIQQGYGEKITELTKQLPDDYESNNNDSLLLALRLAANGKFESAGKKFKLYMDQSSEIMKMADMVSSMDEDTSRGVKVRRSARIGHEAINGTPVEKEAMHRKRLDLIDEVRNDNPEASSRKVHEIAELLSEERFGEKVSYKTFERAEKKQKS